MKLNLFIICTIALSLTVFSCKNSSKTKKTPEQEIEIITNKIIAHTEILNKANKDNKITEQEAIEISKIIKELQITYIDFDNKFKNDQNLQEIIQEYFKNNEIELQKLTKLR
ncbi:MAG: hypothetical protein GX793_05700 [Bacteroidales bacterium]|nr:hypothetical protein [Bacteroidales bacterium]